MKTKNLIFFILFCSNLSFCQTLDKSTWKSNYSELEIFFDSQWKLITPYLDTKSKVIVALTDKTDNSAIVVKITDDVPKEQLSDEEYSSAVKEQMLKANALNKLINDDKIDFKGFQYKRLTFLMKTEFGDVIQTIYTHRNGKKFIALQLSYPNDLIKKTDKDIPEKIEKVLNEMKI